MPASFATTTTMDWIVFINYTTKKSLEYGETQFKFRRKEF